MKNFIFFFSFLMVLSCSKNNDPTLLDSKWEKVQTNSKIDELNLPNETLAKFTSKNEIEFQLPENYSFVTESSIGKRSFSNFGSYTCTCDKNGACTPFYSSETEFGCLQSDCDGKCTGEKSSGGSQLIGIIDNIQNLLELSDHIQTGSLTEDGRNWFSENTGLLKELDKFYDFVLEGTAYKNSEDLINNSLPSEIRFMPVKYLGVEFAIAVPMNDDDISNQFFPEFGKKSFTDVSCSGSNGCTCKKEKKCVLGKCIYWCSGCNPCTITIDEE